MTQAENEEKREELEFMASLLLWEKMRKDIASTLIR